MRPVIAEYTALAARLRDPSSVKAWTEADAQRCEAAAAIEQLCDALHGAAVVADAAGAEIERLRIEATEHRAARDVAIQNYAREYNRAEALKVALTEIVDGKLPPGTGWGNATAHLAGVAISALKADMKA